MDGAGITWVSVRALARETDYGSRTVDRALRELVLGGLIERVPVSVATERDWFPDGRRPRSRRSVVTRASPWRG
jgi:hypothetical protein